MKRNFSLRVIDDELFFCNLIEDGFQLAILDRNYLDYKTVSQFVAHDAVEHSVSHTKKSSVTWEEEFRALGAVEYVRAHELIFGIKPDIQSLFENFKENSNRALEPIPIIMKSFLYHNDYCTYFDCVDEKHVETYADKVNLRNALDQVAWGYYLSEKSFDFSQGHAFDCFNMVRECSQHVIEDIIEYNSVGASVFFDSNKGIFRYRMKWQ